MAWIIVPLVLIGVAIWLLWRGRIGGWSDLFSPAPPRRAPISTSISVSGDSLAIDALDFRGPCIRSPNRKFTLGWSDAASEVAGDQGHIILLIDRQVILHRRLPHPEGGAVSNIGTFAIIDRRPGPEPGAVFHVLSPYGDVLARGRVRGEPTGCGISNNGRFAVCHAVTEPDAPDGGMLSFYVLKMGPSGLKPGGLAWKIESWPDAPASYDIDIVRRQLTVRYSDGARCVYTFDGLALSEDEPDHAATTAATAEIETKSPEEPSGPTPIVEPLDVEPPDEEPSIKEPPDGRGLLEEAEALLSAAAEEVSEDETTWRSAQSLLFEAEQFELPDRVRAVIHRRLGEIAEHLDETDEAIARYEQALELHARVGVKTRLARLRRDAD
ncbi:MAG: hypothetical protein ACYTGG_03675 [Planctomycetota bacterium]|jgi:hypothetical protein